MALRKKLNYRADRDAVKPPKKPVDVVNLGDILYDMESGVTGKVVAMNRDDVVLYNTDEAFFAIACIGDCKRASANEAELVTNDKQRV